MLTAVAKSVLNPLLLRIVLAAIFIFHGLALVGVDLKTDPALNFQVDASKEWGANWHKPKEGDPQPSTVQMAVAWGELIGGVALALGLLTRLAAAGIIAIMVGAIVTIHWPNGFDIAKGGFEYNLAIIVMCLCLVLGGPGPIAVDRFFRLRSNQD